MGGSAGSDQFKLLFCRVANVSKSWPRASTHPLLQLTLEEKVGRIAAMIVTYRSDYYSKKDVGTSRCFEGVGKEKRRKLKQVEGTRAGK